MNIIDALALVPLYLKLVILAIDPDMSGGGTMNLLKTILLLRIIRIFRIFKLMRQYSALKILLYAVKASFRELLMLTIFLMLGVVIFASLIYFAEQSQTKHFDNIPIGFWWAIVTMTTVGYGDTYPTTTLGYVVGTLCALCGVLVLALTIPIISNNFTLFYSHAQSRLKLPKEGKKKYEHNHWAKVDAPVEEEEEEEEEEGVGGGEEDGGSRVGVGFGGGTVVEATKVPIGGGRLEGPANGLVAPRRATTTSPIPTPTHVPLQQQHQLQQQQQQQQQPLSTSPSSSSSPSRGDVMHGVVVGSLGSPPQVAERILPSGEMAQSPARGQRIQVPNAIGPNSQTSALLSGVHVVENLQLESAI